MNRRIQTAVAMSPREWLFLVHAWLAFCVIAVALRLVSLPKLRRFLRWWAPRNAHGVAVAQACRLVRRAARFHPARVVCLQRALCLEHLLHRSDEAVEVRFGVRRAAENTIEAHAWLEVGGEPLGEGESLPSFLRLETVR